jgi:hypothetical protein
VFTKELRDALRDRRTLLMVLLSSVAMGPLVLVALSMLVAEHRSAPRRATCMVGMDTAPTLRNYLRAPDLDGARRAGRPCRGAGAAPLRPSGAGGAAEDFEADLAAGLAPELLLVTSSAQPARPAGSAGSVAALLRGFSQEQATCGWPARRGAGRAAGGDGAERDLADARARAAQFTRLLPFFVLMAVLYGALNAALDTTAGERERGSLEPLLMNPLPRAALVLGKWGRGGQRGHADRGAVLLELLARAVAAAQRGAGGDVPVRLARGGAVPGAAAAGGGAAGGAADGGGHPLPQLQGSAGQHHGGGAGHVAAAAGDGLPTRRASSPGTCGCRRWRRSR